MNETLINKHALRAFMRGAKRIVCVFPPDSETARAIALVSEAESDEADSMNESKMLNLIQSMTGIIYNLCNEYRY